MCGKHLRNSGLDFSFIQMFLPKCTCRSTN